MPRETLFQARCHVPRRVLVHEACSWSRLLQSLILEPFVPRLPRETLSQARLETRRGVPENNRKISVRSCQTEASASRTTLRSLCPRARRTMLRETLFQARLETRSWVPDRGSFSYERGTPVL